jgi:hypothetical protein
MTIMPPVDAEVAGEVVELVGEVEELLPAPTSRALSPASAMRPELEGSRWARFARSSTSGERPSALPTSRMARAALEGDEGAGHRGVGFAVALVHVLDDLFAPIGLKVDVDVGGTDWRSSERKRSKTRSCSSGFDGALMCSR